jgi:hypothetical protein
MLSQGTEDAYLGDNHFMSELERTGNISGRDNIEKAVSRFMGLYIFMKVKFVNKNDARTLNRLSKKMRRNLKYSEGEWPVIWSAIAVPTIIHQVSKRRSSTMQSMKKWLINGKQNRLVHVMLWSEARANLMRTIVILLHRDDGDRRNS